MSTLKQQYQQHKKTALIFMIIFFFLTICPPSFSQQVSIKLITEGEFAKGLVKLMKLERYLPPAPIIEDYINLLESLGVSPLTGWDAQRALTKENYIVLMAMAGGKEKLVAEKAKEACKKYIDEINIKWQEKMKQDGKWTSFDELAIDKTYFPDGMPSCPYGRGWKDKNKDRKIDSHIHF